MADDLRYREAGPDARLAGGQLTIDLRALQANYHALARIAGKAHTAGVVKADAYGLGAEAVVPALVEAGCDTFFVALPTEGIAVREAAPKARIYVLGGLFGREAAEVYAEAALVPVINTREEAAIWEAVGHAGGKPRPCAIHVDTGMNRLGLTMAEARALAEENALTGALRPVLIMSHLACADEREHPQNRLQLEAFRAVRALFSGVPASLANSAGIVLGRDFHFDMVRPGIALYGGSPGGRTGMHPVATTAARIVQIRHAAAGETVSYGATVTLERDTIIAVASAGYADGLHRALSGSGVPLRAASASGGRGFVHGRRVPILGRITMDLTMFDVTELGDGALAVGDTIELFGPNILLDEAAAAAGTISYELLTSMGRRFHRSYVSNDDEA